MTKKVLCVIIVFSISMCFASCKKDDTFNEVLNVVLDVTDYELYIPDEENKGKWDSTTQIYLSNEKDKSSHRNRSFLADGFLYVCEYDSKLHSKGKYKQLGKNEDDSGVVSRTSSRSFVYDENLQDNCIIILEERVMFTDTWYFEADYLLGKNILRFEFAIGSDFGKDKYDEYLKICEKLNLYVNPEVADYIDRFEELIPVWEVETDN